MCNRDADIILRTKIVLPVEAVCISPLSRLKVIISVPVVIRTGYGLIDHIPCRYFCRSNFHHSCNPSAHFSSQDLLLFFRSQRYYLIAHIRLYECKIIDIDVSGKCSVAEDKPCGSSRITLASHLDILPISTELNLREVSS